MTYAAQTEFDEIAEMFHTTEDIRLAGLPDFFLYRMSESFVRVPLLEALELLRDFYAITRDVAEYSCNRIAVLCDAEDLARFVIMAREWAQKRVRRDITSSDIFVNAIAFDSTDPVEMSSLRHAMCVALIHRITHENAA